MEDSGIGIPFDQQDEIFKLFVENNKDKNSMTGVGLGLSYCKMVTQSMNGDIKCTSIPNKGTIFDFYISVFCKITDKGLSDEQQI